MADLLVKDGKLVTKGSGSNTKLVVKDSYDCDCCLPACSGLCVSNSWSITITEMYYVVCGCGVNHPFSAGASAHVSMQLPNVTMPCKQNGKRIDSVYVGDSQSVSAASMTRNSGNVANGMYKMWVNSYNGGGTTNNPYCSNSSVTAKMESSGPAVSGKNCFGSGSIGAHASISGCTCNKGRPRTVFRWTAKASGNAVISAAGYTIRNGSQSFETVGNVNVSFTVSAG